MDHHIVPRTRQSPTRQNFELLVRKCGFCTDTREARLGNVIAQRSLEAFMVDVQNISVIEFLNLHGKQAYFYANSCRHPTKVSQIL